ncbi:DNA ligase [Spongiibacter taiwanensis]|uniref:DNA ligase n=1 Tax=Spongiibacter taiwanensis TaxID=1748242 RepID=UPI002035CF17|nr:DNA ligase [Spongiibacter taiwanensis]USA41886.1 DNA ligase [Spongiibacter taiwanensis]
MHHPSRYLSALLIASHLSLTVPCRALATDTTGQPVTASHPPAAPPGILLAEVYQPGIALTDYWVSEKLDGVRARWDGKQLISRGGNIIAAPPWFTEGFPALALDGELWLGRGRFDETSGAARSRQPDPAVWREMRFMVFDLPHHPGTFDQRLGQLKHISAPYLAVIPQQKMQSQGALMAELDRIMGLGGEGLMLHRGKAVYRAGRSDDLLKLKRHDDAEAVVIAHLPGQGRLQGMMGAILVEMPNGQRFKIGSGFSDEQRRHPPTVGSVVTYKSYGLTANGIPRFASFLRVYSDF